MKGRRRDAIGWVLRRRDLAWADGRRGASGPASVCDNSLLVLTGIAGRDRRSRGRLGGVGGSGTPP